jgi:hypothetical protein
MEKLPVVWAGDVELGLDHKKFEHVLILVRTLSVCQTVRSNYPKNASIR